MSMTKPAASLVGFMFSASVAACICGTLFHSTASTVLGCVGGGVSLLFFLVGLIP